MTQTREPVDARPFDPFDPDTRTDPYPVYAQLRRQSPVCEIPSLGILAVTRHADAAHVLRHPDLFSSSAMHALVMRAANGGAGENPEEPEEVDTLIGTDPPRHTHLRKIVNRGFTRSRIAALEARITAIAHELVERFEQRGRCDLVSELATPFPVTVIAELLGIDPERRDDFKRWSDALLAIAAGNPGPEEQAGIERAFEEQDDYLESVIEERRRRPGDDLISALVCAEEESGGVLTSNEVAFFTRLLLVAGNETTTNLIGNAVLALLAHPAQLARVRARPALVPGLVEEALRYDAPVQLVLRTATTDSEIGGTPVAAGSTLAVLIGSANRDEREFARPDRFDIGRDGRGHLSFGYGTHFCLGAPLARLEARIALSVLLARTDCWELAETDLPQVTSLLMRGPLRLPLRFGGTAEARRSA